ncbi:MAG: zinc ABC transporter solute-binding protein [Rhodobacteraceae bacterium]|nr:zinc ABC transporter solute-binding protein [Paracoccaceae bacterium]
MRLIFALLLCAQPLMAAPKVAATVPPLAELVAEIMRGTGSPAALMPANVEPHDFTLRPSQISAVIDSDIVFAVGLEMEPWLAQIEGDYTVISLGETISEPLPARNFDLSPRGESDPHLWLDPGEMILWELEITQNLIRLDPANTATYRANEFALLKTLVAARDRLTKIGSDMNDSGIKLVVAHDAFQYIERRLGVPLAGMLTDYEEARAGARTLSQISRLDGQFCIINHPEISAPLDMLPAAPRVMLDPIGAALIGEPDFVARFYQQIGDALEGCIH